MKTMRTCAGTATRARPATLAAAVAAALLVACAATPVKPEGAAAARVRLSQLQADPDLTSRAPLAVKEAEDAVRAAEQPQSDPNVGAYLVFMADRKVAVARATAQGHLAIDQRDALSGERAQMQLRARTSEADAANRRAFTATADASRQKQRTEDADRRAALSNAEADLQRQNADVLQYRADASQDRADASQDATAQAQGEAAELRRQIDGMNAKETDRGLVLTLGDVLFAFDTSTLSAGGSTHLNKLAQFLVKYPERTAQIDGYTDSVGGATYNQDLSQRRAEAVKSFLVAQGIEADRLDASGKGPSEPVADNATSSGRQQNRRVEVIIANGTTAVQ